MMEKKNKKSFFKILFKKVKARHLLLLALFLAGNTYAWFIYVNNISNSVDVHVRAWKIDFQDGNTPVTDYVDIAVDEVYPGMTPYTKVISAFNRSEVPANVGYQILEASVMGEDYISKEGKEENGLALTGTEPTSAQLEAMLANDYPFKIIFEVTSFSMLASNGTSEYKINIVWPFESGDDELDTLWGSKAYAFKQDNPSTPCIRIKAKLFITQATD